ncbi:MAG: amidophosphoribosyltransferase [Phycisphaerales bacterium]
MGEFIKHECGLALVRLRKPLSYYREKYGTPTWGLDTLQLIMIKQRNRGQDGAGVALCKLNMPMGEKYLFRKRSAKKNPTDDIFNRIRKGLRRHADRKDLAKLDDATLKRQCEFLGEVYLGHLRYGTHSETGVELCHPYVRRSNWATRNLALAGNFNLTNSDVIFGKLVSYGLRPTGMSDTLTMLEKIGHFLDGENERLRQRFLHESPELSGERLAQLIGESLDVTGVIARASKEWDGGYVFGGLIGNGDAFVCRDPHGIRPGFWYENDEVVAVASERPALTTVFNVEPDAVHELQRGHVLSIRPDGTVTEKPFAKPLDERRCTFERIYFSRGNDPDIYRERKRLGANLAQQTLDAIDGDLANTVFSFIPNTAETAFLGLVEEIEKRTRRRQADELWELHTGGRLTRSDVDRLMNGAPRVEKAAHKDQKLRTFITQDAARGDLVSHVYDITREVVGPGETLVVLDDSIVRGTTLRESIVTMLSRLNPDRIVILSSAPPIRYPDCYGIDMSELGRFVAFEAAIRVRRERDESGVIDEVYEACKADAGKPLGEHQNHVARIYDGISDEELSAMIARIVRPTNIPWKGDLQIIYQTIGGLRDALPGYTGDWYFTGDFPTPGGYKVLGAAFINYYENRSGRSYESRPDDAPKPTKPRPSVAPDLTPTR